MAKFKTADFARALGAVCRIAPARPPAAIIGCVAFDSFGSGEMAAIATDLDVSIRARFDVEGAVPGPPLALGAKGAVAVAKALASEESTMAQENGRVDLSSGTSHFELLASNADDFPQIDFDIEADTEPYAFDAPLFRRLFETVRFAIGDPSRYATDAVTVIFEAKTMTLVCSDQKCFALASDQCELGDSGSLVLSPKAAAAIADGEGPVQLYDLENSYLVRLERVDLVLRKLESPPLDPASLLPQDEPAGWLIADRLALLGAARRVSSLVSSREPAIELKCDEDGLITISCANVDLGSSSDTVLATEASMPTAGIAFTVNPRYLEAFLDKAHADAVRLEFRGPSNPIIIRPEGDSPLLRQVGIVMPIFKS